MRLSLVPFILALPLLSACTQSLEKLREAKPTGGDYLSALAAEYTAYADSEKESGRKYKAEYFAAKGLQALDGNNVEPDEVKAYLAASDRQELEDARATLVALQTAEMKDAAPQKLARAQLLFDCWQHQLVLHTKEKLALCSDEFRPTILELQKLADGSVTGADTTRTVRFADNSVQLSSQASATIAAMVKEAAPFKHYVLQLDGHVETAKTPQALSLAHRRMEAVRTGLMDKGVAEDKIKLLREKTQERGAVRLSVDAPPRARSVDITLRTYSAGEVVQ